MMKVIRAGSVAWTGDNPFIYLKTDPNAKDWSSLSLSFTVRGSDYGAGRLMVVVIEPCQAPVVDVTRIAITDNAPLAGYLIGGFVRKFLPFRAAVGLETLAAVDGATFATRYTSDSWREWGTAPGGPSVDMTWSNLDRAIAIDVPASESPTGAHDMFSVFRMASTAAVSVNGKLLPGRPVWQEFHQLTAPSAAVAVSETWLQR